MNYLLEFGLPTEQRQGIILNTRKKALNKVESLLKGGCIVTVHPSPRGKEWVATEFGQEARDVR